MVALVEKLVALARLPTVVDVLMAVMYSICVLVSTVYFVEPSPAMERMVHPALITVFWAWPMLLGGALGFVSISIERLWVFERGAIWLLITAFSVYTYILVYQKIVFGMGRWVEIGGFACVIVFLFIRHWRARHYRPNKI